MAAPGGSTSVTLPESALTWTLAGTLANVSMVLPDWLVTVTSGLATPVSVTLPESSLMVSSGPGSDDPLATGWAAPRHPVMACPGCASGSPRQAAWSTPGRWSSGAGGCGSSSRGRPDDPAAA